MFYQLASNQSFSISRNELHTDFNATGEVFMNETVIVPFMILRDSKDFSIQSSALEKLNDHIHVNWL